LDLDRYEHRPSRPSASPTTDGLSNGLPPHDALHRHRGRLLQVLRDGTLNPDLPPPVPRPAPPGPPRLNKSTGVQGPWHLPTASAGGGSRSSPITYLFSLARIGSSATDPLDKRPTVQHRAPPTTPAFPDPMTLPLRLRPRLLQGRHAWSAPHRRPGHSPDLPALHDLPFRPSSRSRSR
jgi:hypothetical protein